MLSVIERLTVKLRGRAPTPTRRRGRTLSPGARGTTPLAVHGPLERLLGWLSILSLMRWIRGASIQAMTAMEKGSRRIPRSIKGTSGASVVIRHSMRYKQPPIVNQPRKSRNDLSFTPVGVSMPVGADVSSDQGQSHLSRSMQNYLRRLSLRPLTVKLRGRTEALDQRRGRILSFRARGAQPQAHHGPLQRLLGARCAMTRPSAAPATPSAAFGTADSTASTVTR
jgi:hypothetical protein